MAPLLTIASKRWHSRHRSRVPYEDREIAGVAGSGVEDSPGAQISGGNHPQLYVWPGVPPQPPHIGLIR
ncbi:hypothetical protein [Streptomyces sp. NPDC090021]|uniref:hypothetical protein n=1 Tax=Streptomyces sp. NPDC090021 TaxID=3365919 RepID=UPI0038007180